MGVLSPFGPFNPAPPGTTPYSSSPWTNLGGTVGLSQPGLVTPYYPPGQSWNAPGYTPSRTGGSGSGIVPPAAPAGLPWDQNANREQGLYGTGAPVDPYTQLGLPQAWLDWFPKVYGAMGAYYDAEGLGRGGPKGAIGDYQTFANQWGQGAGRQLQNEELNRFWNAYSGYAGALRRTPNVADLFNFASRQLQGAPRPPQLSYMMRGGEI